MSRGCIEWLKMAGRLKARWMDGSSHVTTVRVTWAPVRTLWRWTAVCQSTSIHYFPVPAYRQQSICLRFHEDCTPTTVRPRMLLIAYPSWIHDTATTEQPRSATASTVAAALLLRMTLCSVAIWQPTTDSKTTEAVIFAKCGHRRERAVDIGLCLSVCDLPV